MPAVRESRKPRERKDYKPVAKEDRRNLKAWAHGAPESILEPHIPGYTDALEHGFEAERDYLLLVYQEYHARIDWRIGDFKDIPLPLPDFDKFALPVHETLTDDETVRKRRRVREVNARIVRWLNRYKDSPKARQAFQQYMHESYESEISPTVSARWAAERTNIDGQGAGATQKKPDAPFRARVARELFSGLEESEQIAFKERAQAEAQMAREAYNKAMKSGPSKEPAARQRCIDNLGSFMAPILQGIQDYTGLHSMIIFGGPFPRYGGELKTLHVSYGRNHGPVPAHMPQWAKHRFDRDVIDLMKAYLETAFKLTWNSAPVEQRAAALPQDSNPLDGARYRFDDMDHDSADGSDSDQDLDEQGSSESGSDSEESDSEDSETDPEMDEKERKQRARAKTKKRSEKARAKEKEKKKRQRAKEKEQKTTAKESWKGEGNKKPKTARASAAEPDDDAESAEEPMTYDQLREANIRRNKASLAAIDVRLAAEGVVFGPDGIPLTPAEVESQRVEAADKAREKETRKAAASAAKENAPPPCATSLSKDTYICRRIQEDVEMENAGSSNTAPDDSQSPSPPPTTPELLSGNGTPGHTTSFALPPPPGSSRGITVVDPPAPPPTPSVCPPRLSSPPPPPSPLPPPPMSSAQDTDAEVNVPAPPPTTPTVEPPPGNVAGRSPLSGPLGLLSAPPALGGPERRMPTLFSLMGRTLPMHRPPVQLPGVIPPRPLAQLLGKVQIED
ncbi:hypothetical protein C8R43DRAFT_1128513 [Mycena crocata]|nr:hypothetical protein C8R43DRAFT_1128513 [Mycena crocata]